MIRRRISNTFMIRITLFWAMAVAVVPELAVAAGRWSHVRSPANLTNKFVIYYKSEEISKFYRNNFLYQRRQGNPAASNDLTDLDKRQIKTELLNDLVFLFGCLNKSAGHFQTMNFERAALRARTDKQGTKYQQVLLYDFGKKHWRLAGKVTGRYSDEHRTLHLNLRHLILTKRWPGGRNRFSTTVAHELFHAIQRKYSPGGEPWMKESTATWAANRVYRDRNPHLNDMRKYVRNMHFPLTYDERLSGESILYDMRFGRPYGTAVFIRFLTARHPSGHDIVKQMLMKTSSYTPALTGLSKALGDSSVLGQSFREYFDRFAVGALLLDQAPPSHRLHDVHLFAGAAVRPIRTNLSAAINRFYANSFESPDKATLEIAFGPGGNRISGRRATINQQRGELAGCAARYFAVGKPPEAPDSVPLDVLVKAGEKEVSFQALARFGASWKIIESQYDSANGGHIAHIPSLGKMQLKYAYLVVCRYSDQEDFTTYPITLVCADPAVLERLEVTQRQSTVVDLEWPPPPAESRTAGRPRKTNKNQSLKSEEAEVVLTFSQAIRQQEEKPICLFNGRHKVELSSKQNGQVWSGTLEEDWVKDALGTVRFLVNAEAVQAGSKAVMPLDQDPQSRAVMQFTKWDGYERQGRGMEITLAKPQWYLVKEDDEEEEPDPAYLHFEVIDKNKARVFFAPGSESAAKDLAEMGMPRFLVFEAKLQADGSYLIDDPRLLRFAETIHEGMAYALTAFLSGGKVQPEDIQATAHKFLVRLRERSGKLILVADFDVDVATRMPNGRTNVEKTTGPSTGQAVPIEESAVPDRIKTLLPGSR